MDDQINVLTLRFPEKLDTNNAKAFLEEVLLKIEGLPDETMLIGDMDKTEYVSSAGLRILVIISKKHKNFKLINATMSVFDTIDMTGITRFLKTERKIIRIEPIKDEPLAQGSNGSVYVIENDIIVKMFTGKTSEEEINEELYNAKTALSLGVPSVICYSLVSDGENLGIMFERMDSASMSSVVYSDYDNFNTYARRFAELFKEIHSINDYEQELNPVKDRFDDLIKTASYLSEDERSKMRAFLEAVPERDNIIHGDFHPNNIGFNCGEFIILDMAEIGYGNPVFDFMASYYDLIFSGKTIGVEHPEVTKKFFGLEVGELVMLWDALLADYFPDLTDEKKSFFNETINMMLGFKLMLFPALHPNFPKEKHESWMAYGRELFMDNYEEIMARIPEIDKYFE